MRSASQFFAWLAVFIGVCGCDDADSAAPGPNADSGIHDAPSEAASLEELVTKGPYPVATRSFTFVDTARSTPANGSYAGASARTLPTRVWYPAAGTTSDGAASAEPAPGPFPVILYAHGFLSSKDEAGDLKVHLASHGYVVIAPDFPLSGFAAPGGPTFRDLADQPRDLEFVAEQVKALTGDDALLAASLDETKEGAAGLSLGGATTLIAAYHPALHLAKVKAAVAFAPVSCFFTKALYQRALPMLVVSGSADELVPLHTIEERTLEYAPAPLTLVRLLGGTHVGFLGIDAVDAGNVDELIGCAQVQNAIDGGATATGNLATELDRGADAGVLDQTGCPGVCSEKFTQTMRGPRQLELAKAVAFAHFEAIFRGRADAAQFLRAGLALAATDVSVTTRE